MFKISKSTMLKKKQNPSVDSNIRNLEHSFRSWNSLEYSRRFQKSLQRSTALRVQFRLLCFCLHVPACCLECLKRWVYAYVQGIFRWTSDLQKILLPSWSIMKWIFLPVFFVFRLDLVLFDLTETFYCDIDNIVGISNGRVASASIWARWH